MSKEDLNDFLDAHEKTKLELLEKNLEAFQTLYVKTLGYDDKLKDQQRQIQKLDEEVAELKQAAAYRPIPRSGS
jgi:hypothetical protein